MIAQPITLYDSGSFVSIFIYLYVEKVLSHTDLTNLTEGCIAEGSQLVGFAECIHPGGSAGEATRFCEIREICVK